MNTLIAATLAVEMAAGSIPPALSPEYAPTAPAGAPMSISNIKDHLLAQLGVVQEGVQDDTSVVVCAHDRDSQAVANHIGEKLQDTTDILFQFATRIFAIIRETAVNSASAERIIQCVRIFADPDGEIDCPAGYEAKFEVDGVKKAPVFACLKTYEELRPQDCYALGGTAFTVLEEGIPVWDCRM